MIETISLLPGITLRCYRIDRFKQAALSIQFLQPMAEDQAAKNALLPAVLLRGTKQYPDLRDITLRLDDLYGASVSALVRRLGDYQTTGLYCGFIEDKFALEGDQVLAPMVDFLRQLLLEPVTEQGIFLREYVEGEKKNLISTIESELNDKRAYAAGKLLRTMCKKDSFGIPRLGTVQQVREITAENLWIHYQKLIKESRVEIFYVGSAQPQQVAAQLQSLFADIDRCYVNLKEQTPFQDGGGSEKVEEMEVSQSHLCMGFVTPITNRSVDFAAMQVVNSIFGAGMTSKLFMEIREKMSACYAIGSGYYGGKGIVTVSAGIDSSKEPQVRQEILKQLALCADGQITDAELQAAKEGILSGLRTIHDSPGAIEGYYTSAALNGLNMDPAQYMEAVSRVNREQAAAAAATLRLHSTYFLKGVAR